MWKNAELRDSVLEDALPKLLLEKIGLSTIIERVSLLSLDHDSSVVKL